MHYTLDLILQRGDLSIQDHYLFLIYSKYLSKTFSHTNKILDGHILTTFNSKNPLLTQGFSPREVLKTHTLFIERLKYWAQQIRTLATSSSNTAIVVQSTRGCGTYLLIYLIIPRLFFLIPNHYQYNHLCLLFNSILHILFRYGV